VAEGPRRLSAAAIAIVAVGIAFVVAVAFLSGDAATAFYIAPIILLGVVVVGVAVKTRAGKIHPRECPNCDGLISPNAPYCKHCGSPL
jgi:hypothetical protein